MGGRTLSGVEAAADRGDVEGIEGVEGVEGIEGIEGIEGGVEELEPVVAEPVAERRESPALDRIQDDLDDVERALQQLDEGTYGNCQACGTAIADEVLDARPTARFCAEHESAPAS